MNQAVRWEDAASSYDTAYLIAKGYYTEKRDRPFDAASSGRLHHQLLPRPAVYARFWTAHQWICANPRGQTPDWCDECGVNSAGVRSTAPADTGWMGCPLAPAYAADTGSTMRQMINAGTPYNLSDHVWLREFTNALVIVNPTTSTQWVTVPAGGWNKIRGFDTAHNSGGGSIKRPECWPDGCVCAQAQRFTDADADIHRNRWCNAHTDADAHRTPTWTPTHTPTRTPTLIPDRNGYADMDANTADANGDIHRLAHVDGNKHGNADLDTGC